MKRGNNKRIITLFCTLLLMVAVPANATENYELMDKETLTVQPRFTNISVFMNSFDITTSGKAVIESVLSARDCDEVRISMYLQRYEGGKWVNVKNWAETRKGMSMLLSKNWYVPSGYQYRMKSYGYAYSNGQLVESTVYISESKIY